MTNISTALYIICSFTAYGPYEAPWTGLMVTIHCTASSAARRGAGHCRSPFRCEDINSNKSLPITNTFTVNNFTNIHDHHRMFHIIAWIDPIQNRHQISIHRVSSYSGRCWSSVYEVSIAIYHSIKPQTI